jgi:hypothetical protein
MMRRFLRAIAYTDVRFGILPTRAGFRRNDEKNSAQMNRSGSSRA